VNERSREGSTTESSQHCYPASPQDHISEHRQLIIPILRPAIFNPDVLMLHKASFVQAFTERRNEWLEGTWRTAVKKSDSRHRLLLRAP
jgi:hypothetical protein